MKTTRRTVSIDSDVSERAVAQAVAENRTLSNFVNTLLRARFSTPTRRKASRNEPIVTSLTPTRRKASKKEVPA